MADGADIALPDTGVPVELDRIYASLRDLSEALGPNGVNKDGTLDHLLEAGANALDGQGAARQRDDPPALRGRGDVRRGRRAAVRHRRRSWPSSPTRWPPTTGWSARSSRTWPASRRRWSPSAPRSSRRSPRSPTRSARSRRSCTTTAQALVTDVEKLTRVMKTINSERDSIDTALRSRRWRSATWPSPSTPSPARSARGSASRASSWDADGFLCAIVQQSEHAQGQQGPRLHDLRAAARAGRGPASRRSAAGRAAGRAADSRRRRAAIAASGRPRRLRRRRRRLADRAAWEVAHEPSARGAPGRPARRRGAAAHRLRVRRRLRPAAARRARSTRTTRITVTAEFEDILNVVPKSPVMVDDVTVGEVTDVERVGWHAKITHAGPQRRRPARQRDRRHPPGQPARREVRRPRAADRAAPPTGRLGDGDNIPLSDDRPQPRGRGGARRAVVPAQRRRRRPARHHHPGAQQGDGRARRSACATCSARSTDVVGTLDDQKADIIRAMESIEQPDRDPQPREADRSTDALDVAGPAVKVLADQHDELIAMLGVAGPARRGRHPGDRRQQGRPAQVAAPTSQPVLSRLHEAGDELAPGLNLLISFPFPKEASEIVKGDYANTSIRADINLENLLPPGAVPDLPVPDIPTRTCRRPGRGARRRPEVPAQRRPHQQGLPEGARRRRPAHQAEEGVQEDEVQRQPGLHGRSTPLPGRRRRPGRPLAATSRAARPGRSTARCPSGSPSPAPPTRASLYGGDVMTRGVRIRIAAFLVLSAVGIVYITASYLGFVDRVLGRGLTVHATLPTSGGLFEGSEVTYRGVKIGKVSAMHATRDGVTLDLALEDGTELPADSPMYVHNLSAVGEQYLDFEPPDDEGPYAEDGDTLAGNADVAAGRRGRPAGRARPVRRLGRQGEPPGRGPRARARCSTTPACPLQQLLDNGTHVHRRGVGAHGRDPGAARQRADRAADPAGPGREHPLLLPRPGRGSPTSLQATATRTCAPRCSEHARRRPARSTRLLDRPRADAAGAARQRRQRQPGRGLAPRRARAAAGDLPARRSPAASPAPRATATATSTCSSTNSVQPCTEGYMPRSQWRPP